jgi:Uma2 family endonuclease
VPVVLDDYSEPEPDIAVVPRRARNDHPAASEALLLIEVAQSSYPTDVDKLATYGRASVPNAWLVDLRHEQVKVCSQPDPATPTGYSRHRIAHPGDHLSLPDEVNAAPDLLLPVADIFTRDN